MRLPILLIILTACTSTTMNLNQLNEFGEDQSRRYDYSRHLCIKTLKRVLSHYGPKLISEQYKRGIYVTDKMVITAKGHAPIKTNQTKYKKTDSAILKQDKTGLYINQKQSYQYNFKITGDSQKCQVTISKFRVWIAGKRIYEVPYEYVVNSIWKPFFRNYEKALPRYN